MKKRFLTKAFAMALAVVTAFTSGNFTLPVAAADNTVVNESEAYIDMSGDEYFVDEFGKKEEASEFMGSVKSEPVKVSLAENDPTPIYVSTFDLNRSKWVYFNDVPEGKEIKVVKVLSADGTVVGGSNVHNWNEIYFTKKDIKEGSYSLEIECTDGTKYTFNRKVEVTSKSHLEYVGALNGVRSSEDYLYLAIQGINLANQKYNVKIMHGEEELSVKEEDSFVYASNCYVIKYKKENWPELKDQLHASVSIEGNADESIDGDIYINESGIINAVFNPVKNTIECNFGEDVPDGDASISVFKYYGAETPILETTVSVKDGYGIIKPDIKLIDKIGGNGNLYIQYKYNDEYGRTSSTYSNYMNRYYSEINSRFSMNSSYREGSKVFINLSDVASGTYEVEIKDASDQVVKKVALTDSTEYEVNGEKCYRYYTEVSDLGVGKYTVSTVYGEKTLTGSFTIFSKDKVHIVYAYGAYVTEDKIIANVYTNATKNDKVTATIYDIFGNEVKSDVPCSEFNNSDEAFDRYYSLDGIKYSELTDRYYYITLKFNGKEPLNADGDKSFYSEENGGKYGYLNNFYKSDEISFSSTLLEKRPEYRSDVSLYGYNVSYPVTVNIYNPINFNLVKSFKFDKAESGNNLDTRCYFTEDNLKDVDTDLIYFMCAVDSKGLFATDTGFIDVDKRHFEAPAPNPDAPGADVPNAPIIGNDQIAVKQKFDAKAVFANANIKKFATSNKKIATVTGKGVVTGKGEGTVVITGLDKKKNPIVSMTIQVVKPVINAPTLEKKGQTVSLNAIISNVPANSKVTWTYSKKANAVCTVSGNSTDTDVLVANKTGKFKVTANITNAQNKTVKYKAVIKVTLPKLNKASLKLKAGKEKALKVSNTSLKVSNWYSTDEKVATVSADGLVKAVAAGECKVIAVIDGAEYTCTVKVK